VGHDADDQYGELGPDQGRQPLQDHDQDPGSGPAHQRAVPTRVRAVPAGAPAAATTRGLAGDGESPEVGDRAAHVPWPGRQLTGQSTSRTSANSARVAASDRPGGVDASATGSVIAMTTRLTRTPTSNVVTRPAMTVTATPIAALATTSRRPCGRTGPARHSLRPRTSRRSRG